MYLTPCNFFLSFIRYFHRRQSMYTNLFNVPCAPLTGFSKWKMAGGWAGGYQNGKLDSNG